MDVNSRRSGYDLFNWSIMRSKKKKKDGVNFHCMPTLKVLCMVRSSFQVHFEWEVAALEKLFFFFVMHDCS